MDRKDLAFEKPLAEIEKEIEHLKNQKKEHFIDTQPKIVQLQQKLAEKTTEIFDNLSSWQKVQLARHPNRPHALDYIAKLFDDFVELHGDAVCGDDPAVISGIGKLDGLSVAVIGQQKGRDVKENLKRKFGMPHPEGYRKARRIMHLAERFGFPVITLVDTPGANPDLGAEERGQAQAIATNLMEMAYLKTAVVCVIIGEGGSGGALGLAVGDRVLMQKYSIYSVISPEGCASILWKNQQPRTVEEAARALKLTAQELYELRLIDGIIPEPDGGAHKNFEQAAELLRQAVRTHLTEVKALKTDELVEMRYQKYKKMGVFVEQTIAEAE